jgi:hypothetical protein
MVRSHWYGAVFVGLALTGLVRGQSSASGNAPASEQPKERFITVKELEKPNLRCKVLKTWQEPDGSKAYLVQAVTTLEKITIVERGPLTTAQQDGKAVKAVSTSIFHWGKGDAPPPGAPEAPANALVLGQPLTKPLTPPEKPAATPPAVAKTPGPTSAPVVSKPTPPAPTPTVVKPATPAPTNAVAAKTPAPPSPENMWPPAFATQKPAADGKDGDKSPSGPPTPPTATAKKPEPEPVLVKKPEPDPVLATPVPPPVAPKPVETKVVVKPLSPSPGTSPLPEVKMPPSGTAIAKTPADKPVADKPAADKAADKPVATTAKAPETKAGPIVVSPLTEAKEATRTTARLPADVAPVPAPTPPTPPSPPVPTPWAKAPADSADWRASWGKADASKGTTVARSDKPADAPKGAAVVRNDKPAADMNDTKKAADPLQDPGAFKRPDLDGKDAKKAAPKAKDDAAPPSIAEMASEKKFLSAKPLPVASPPPGTPRKDQAPAPLPPGMEAVPPGLGSVAAAISPELEENPGKGPPVVLSARGNAFTEAKPGTYPPGMMMDRGAPPGLANAFTPGGTGRPIPADFGGPAAVANAFTSDVNDRRQPYAPQGQLVMVNPAMAVPPRITAQAGAASAGDQASLPQLQAVLRDSLYPSQREWAAEKLAALDWRREPRIVDCLTKAAHDDPAPTVRAGCVRCLAQMHLNTVPVVSVIQSLKTDADPRVRHEVEQALAVLGVPTQPGDASVQPASLPGLR